MFETKASVFVFICAFLILVQCKLSTKERLQAERECVDEVQIDYNIILEVKTTLVVSDDVKYKQFLNCFYEKQGFKTKTGQIKWNELKEVLLEGYSSLEVDKLLQPCKEIRALESDDLPVLILKCILANVQKTSDVDDENID